MEVQTRSEENGLRYFPSVDAALNHADTDKTVWKISFDSQIGERIRFVKSPHGWILETVYGQSGAVMGKSIPTYN